MNFKSNQKRGTISGSLLIGTLGIALSACFLNVWYKAIGRNQKAIESKKLPFLQIRHFRKLPFLQISFGDDIDSLDIIVKAVVRLKGMHARITKVKKSLYSLKF